MTRLIKVAFCVLALTASVTLAGCGNTEEATTPADDTTTSAPAEGEGSGDADGGSDSK